MFATLLSTDRTIYKWLILLCATGDVQNIVSYKQNNNHCEIITLCFLLEEKHYLDDGSELYLIKQFDVASYIIVINEADKALH